MSAGRFPFFRLIAIFCLQSCHTYLIDKDSAAKQMTNLKIESRVHSTIELPGGTGSGSGYYNNLDYLVIDNQISGNDTIYPFEAKFFLKSGINSGWRSLNRSIFKDGYFIAFFDTTLKTNPKCKFCKINIDSIEKILIRGSRLNKKK